MKLLTLLSAAVIASALAGPAEDYRELAQGLPAFRMSGTSGGVAMQGRLTFPLAISKKREVVAAAGYFGDAEKGGRIVCFAHTSFVDAGSGEQSVAARNAARWAARKAEPVVAVIGTPPRIWKDAGFATKSGSLAAQDLQGVDVVVMHLHAKPIAQEAANLEAYARRGGGVILLATPWALAEEQLRAANAFLASSGLSFHGSGSSEDTYPVSPEPPSQNWSALHAANALLAERKGQATLSVPERQLCAASIMAVLEAAAPAPAVNAALDELDRAFGWIRFAKSPALRKANNPVEALLARYQARRLENMLSEKLVAHPSAADFPGAVGEGPAVTKTARFIAQTGADKLINHGKKTIVNTGLYARPGVPITVTIPAAAAAAGLKVEIGIHTDRNWNLSAWRRAPQISRTEELKTRVTKVGNAFGGLVSILVPANCQLGDTEATIAGAVEAPVFTLGKTTEAEWNRRAKHAPGAWGYIETPKWTGYVPREILQTIDHPQPIAEYWQKVVETADEFMGYAKWRRRGEAMLTDRDITVGYGHAGYPVMMAYAAEEEGARALVERGPQRGDWGFLHELGHTFQDSFDGEYTIATHAEVDVNLVPAIVIMLVHNRTAWDNNSHGTFDARNRAKDMAAWDAKPEAERTWDKACKGSSVAYDFYFTMAECFGWDLYKRALGRLADWLHEPGKDPDLDALDRKSPNYKRDRLFLCFSQAAGRNLLPHFQRYGLGRGEFGLTSEVTGKVAKLPPWSGNQPISALHGPDKVAVKPGAQTGALVCEFQAVDPDPGTRFTFRIASGNDDGTFAIEPRAGTLTLAKPAGSGARVLVIEAHDSTIPLSSLSRRCEVTIGG